MDKIEKFIETNSLAVLATASSECLPEAAVIGYAKMADFNLVFATFITAEKYQNLKTNSMVALVIGWEGGKTVQYEGSAAELSGQELAEGKAILTGKVPSAAKYIGDVEARFFRIAPKRIRYSDWSYHPPEEFEIRF